MEGPPMNMVPGLPMASTSSSQPLAPPQPPKQHKIDRCIICKDPLANHDDHFPLNSVRTISSNVLLAEKVDEIVHLSYHLTPEQAANSSICPICHDLVEQVDFFDKNAEETKRVIRERGSNISSLPPLLGPGVGYTRRRKKKTPASSSVTKEEDDADGPKVKRGRGRPKKNGGGGAGITGLLTPKVQMSDDFVVGKDPFSDDDGEWKPSMVKTEPNDDGDDNDDDFNEDFDNDDDDLFGNIGGSRVKKEPGEDPNRGLEIPVGSMAKITGDQWDGFKLMIAWENWPTFEPAIYDELLCQACGERFGSWLAKCSHWMTAHSPNQFPFQCPVDRLELHPTKLQDHAVQMHAHNDSEVVWRRFSFVQDHELPKETNHHFQAVLSDGRLQCPLCGIICYNSFSFFYHRQIQHKRGIPVKKCPFCPEDKGDHDITYLIHHVLRGHMGIAEYALPKLPGSNNGSSGAVSSFKRERKPYRKHKQDPFKRITDEYYALYQMNLQNENDTMRKLLDGLMNPEKFLQKEKVDPNKPAETSENGEKKEEMTGEMKQAVGECLARATNVNKAPLKIGSKPECVAWDIARMKMGKLCHLRVPGDEYCYECPEQFADPDGRIHHIFEEHMGAVAPYQCGICHQKLTDFRKARKHLDVHRDATSGWITGIKDLEGKIILQREKLPHEAAPPPPQYQCEKCYITSNSELAYWFHYKETHWEEETPSACQFCGKKTKGPHVYVNHILNCHGSYGYICVVCDDIISTPELFRDHCKQHLKSSNPKEADPEYSDFDHKGKLLLPSVPPLALSTQNHITRVDRLKCEYCQIEIVGPRNLSRHMWSAHQMHHPAPCRVCGRVFPTFQEFSDHNLQEHGKSETCHLCGQQFRNKHGFANHMINKHGEESDKQYMCDICARSFASKHHLKTHMATHSEVKNHQCPHCERAFKWGTSLSSHIKAVHTDTGYSCKVCGKVFKDKSNLKNHMYTHSLEKPYNCSKCGKGFIRRDTCATHERQCSTNFNLPTY